MRVFVKIKDISGVCEYGDYVLHEGIVYTIGSTFGPVGNPDAQLFELLPKIVVSLKSDAGIIRSQGREIPPLPSVPKSIIPEVPAEVQESLTSTSSTNVSPPSPESSRVEPQI